MPVNGGPGGNPGNGAGGNTGGIGRQRQPRQRKQGGNGAPPGMRLIDMHVMPLPPGTGLPPPGETRFSAEPGRVAVRRRHDAAADRRHRPAFRAHHRGAANRSAHSAARSIRSRSTTVSRWREVIRAIDTAGLNAAAQPNYTYGLTQDQSGPTGGSRRSSPIHRAKTAARRRAPHHRRQQYRRCADRFAGRSQTTRYRRPDRRQL